jgi:hypothetical protein
VSEPFYTTRSKVEKAEGKRVAHLEAGPTVEFGVHGPVKRHFKLDQLPDVPLPVDYIAAATGG